MTRLALVALVVAALVGLFLFGLLRGQPDRDIASNLLGKPAPGFALPVYEQYWGNYGDTLALSRYVGEKPVVINFWASWCLPCRDEAPLLEQAWRELGDEVLFIGIQTQEKGGREEGRRFLNEFGLSFPNLIDDDSAVGIDYGVFGIPETFFIGRDGALQHKHVGPLTPEVLQAQLGALL